MVEYTDTGIFSCFKSDENLISLAYETQTSAFDFTTMMFQSIAKGATNGHGIIFDGQHTYEVECEGAFLANGNTITFPTPTTCTGITDGGSTEFGFQTQEAIITCNEEGDTCVSSLLKEDQVVTILDGRPNILRNCSSTRTLVRTGQSTGGGGPTVSYEFESELMVVDNDGTTSSKIKTDSGASNGQYFLYQSNAVGEFVTFEVPIATPGTNVFDIQYHLARYRGTFNVAVAESVSGTYIQIGEITNTVNSGVTYPTLTTMSAPISGSVAYVRFTVTGSNPNTGSERIGLDKIDVIPQ